MRKELLISIGLFTSLGVWGAPISPEQALERLKGGRQEMAGIERLETKPVWTAHTKSGVASAYVFNNKDGKGFRVLSADDSAYAVLGYSDDLSFTPENISPEFIFWMDYLGSQIEYYTSKGVEGSASLPVAYEGLKAINPQVKSKWNQDAPYYNDCPKIGKKNTYSGCVATSMAQVMNYFKYPEVGTGSNTYQWDKGNSTLTMDFGEKAFDWENMLDVYSRNRYNQTQADAVAFLMKSCGYSVNMDYGTSASGTQGVYIAYALKNYFKYDANVTAKFRITYSANEWAQMVYDNLKNCGPVIMNGQAYEDAGHSFICDGYDGQGYFHFNWGWGGISDGWYLLEAMDPGAQGIGGSTGGGFNYRLNGIFGIQKPTGDPVVEIPDNLIAYGGMIGSINENQLSVVLSDWYPDGWFAASDHEVRVNVGGIIEPIDGTTGVPQSINGKLGGRASVKLQPGVYFPGSVSLIITLPALADGKYKLTVACRDLEAGKTSPYIPILHPYGVANYVYITVAEGVISVENVEIPKLLAEGVTLETDLYYGKYARYNAKLKNNSDYELTESMSPGLILGGKLVMVGSMVPSTVAPNTIGEVEWISKMVLVAGGVAPTKDTEYTLAVVNPITHEVLGEFGKVTMHPRTVNSTLRANVFEIEDSKLIEAETPYGVVRAYKIDGDSFTANLEYLVMSGFFDGTLSVGIYQRNPDDGSVYDPVMPGVYSVQPFLPADTEERVSIPVNFPDGEPGTVYSLAASYTNNTQSTLLQRINFVMSSSGVEDIEEFDDMPVKYYNIQGMEITHPQEGQIYIMKQGAKVRKVKK